MIPPSLMVLFSEHIHFGAASLGESEPSAIKTKNKHFRWPFPKFVFKPNNKFPFSDHLIISLSIREVLSRLVHDHALCQTLLPFHDLAFNLVHRIGIDTEAPLSTSKQPGVWTDWAGGTGWGPALWRACLWRPDQPGISTQAFITSICLWWKINVLIMLMASITSLH